MFRKINITVIAAVFAVFFGALAAAAQTAPASGIVELKKSDGTVVPVAGAVVDMFRTDIKSSGPSAKTNKNGQFNFVGLQLGATFVLSVSAPGAQPTYYQNVRAGVENLKIMLSEGDGRRLTEDEVRQALAQGSSTAAAPKGELTAEQKKAIADRAKLEAEHAAKKQEVEGKNVLIAQALKEGNAAYEAKNYDVAVAKYNDGIQAEPDFAGSAPVLLNNKAASLTARAVLTYNQNVKSTDATAKMEAMKAVRKDFAEAIDSYDRSWNILKSAVPADIDPKSLESNKASAARGARETFKLMVLTEQVDDTKAAIANTLIPEYIAVETDPAKKEEAKLILADVYRVAGDSEKAITEYKKVLEGSPNNLDAMAGLGLSLVNNGYLKEDKAQLQEGANVLQRFAAAAPATHKYKDDALGLIENLKSEQNIAPQKTTGTKKKN